MSYNSRQSDVVVSAHNVGKCYNIYDNPKDRLKQAFWWGRRKYYREFWALRNVSFDVKRGEALGIIGRNGSGKSTLLQVVAGTLTPSEGEVSVRGRVAALLELGSGFNPDFTGCENVFMNGAILGLSRQEMEEKYEDIVAFADIGEFINQPVKTYSSGMVVRLAFAVQVQVQPDILIIDEALSVGDILFQKRCFQKMEELRSNGVTLLFVSHDQECVRTLTSRAILLKEGLVRSYGKSADVVLDYRRLLHDEESIYYKTYVDKNIAKKQATTAAQNNTKNRSDRLSFGDFDAEIINVEVINPKGEACTVFYPGEKMLIRVKSQIHKNMTNLNVAIRIRNKEGVKMYSWGTLNQDIMIWCNRAQGAIFWDREFSPGDVVTVDFECECTLGVNFYEIQAGISEEEDRFYNAQRVLHWQDEAAFFQVCMSNREYFFGGTCDMRMKSYVRD